MEACRRLLSTQQTYEWYKAKAEYNSSILSALEVPKGIHNLTDTLTMNPLLCNIDPILKEMLYEVRYLKSSEDMILALAGQFKQLSHEPEKIT